MALINCPECQTEVSDKAAACVKCGCPIAANQEQPSLSTQGGASAQAQPIVVKTAKSRGVYIILGLLFGGLGLHNFYAGQNARGALKCGLLMFTLFIDIATGFYTAFSILWMVVCAFIALWEIIVTKSDASGALMA